MSITFSGLATGLDTDSIVKDIMALERAPLDRIEAKKTAEAERLKAYDQFKSRLDDLKSAVSEMTLTSQVRATSVSLSSEDTFTASTTSGATGSYNIAVAQLSQVQKTVTAGFSSNTEAILGSGSITVNGTSISVTEDNNSLLGLAQAINAEAGTTGVRATIINDGSEDSPYHLVFTGKDASSAFTVEASLVDESETPIAFSTTDAQTAQQAIVYIDGIEVVSDSNTISTAISGVTLNLTSASTLLSAEGDPPVYETARMDIKADTGAVKEKVTSFVSAYNGVMNWILSGYEEFGGGATVDEDSEEDALLGTVLRGDATINSVKRQLQGVLTSAVDNSGGLRILSELGITTNLNGTLNQNNTKLDAALENKFDDVVYLLSGDDDTAGVMKNFNTLLLDLTSGTKGMYATKKTAYDSAIGRFDLQIDQMELRLTKREDALRSQFSYMEQLVSSLNAQGDFLTQQMDALNRDR